MNLVLASIGSAICATRADIHPMSVIVSMRQTDSLQDSESYFFAEVKRLKQIFDQLESQVSFILLDEILKGTNSEDKRNGTIEVIKKLVTKNAIGIIATHDLEVCEITKDYQGVLVNKHFEVELDCGDLHFDYKLRDGVCKSKSATFLMKKMGVI
jgi:DNA mismatch repair ATPase MutS